MKKISCVVTYPIILDIEVSDELLLEENSDKLREIIIDKAEGILTSSYIEPEWEFKEV